LFKIKAFVLAGLFSCTPVWGAYPEKPLTLVVPYPPGGTTDALARIVAAALSKDLGTTVVVENKGGAGGILGTTAVARAKPDGYTVLFGNVGPNALNVSTYKTLPYDASRDFQPISLVANFPLFLVVHPSVPAKTVQELVTYAKTLPSGLDYASVGTGSLSHLTGQLFSSSTGAPLVHIPYKGGGPAVTDLLGGQVPMMFLSVYDNNIRSGRLRAIGTSSKKRSSVAPDVPTLAESGVPNFDVTAWFGILAPAQTPAPIITLLHDKLAAILAQPSIRAQIQNFGGEPVSNSPAEFSALVTAEIERWKGIVKNTPAFTAE
jgi:tripartite-type tricarboxylate transporter receptor subunit TctC